METVFGDLNRKGQEYSYLTTANVSLYQSEALQWDCTGDLLPKRVVKRSGKKEKVLDISYEPLFDDHDRIQHILYAISDATKTVEAEKEIAKKNEVLNIIGHLIDTENKENLKHFVESANKYNRKAREIAENVKSISIKESELFNEIFLCLHTIKGGSGKLDILGNKVHEVEGQISDLIKNEFNVKTSGFILEDFIRGLYEIEGIIFNYIKVANEMLGMGINYTSPLINLVRESFEKLLNEERNLFKFKDDEKLSNFSAQELHSRMMSSSFPSQTFLKIKNNCQYMRQLLIGINEINTSEACAKVCDFLSDVILNNNITPDLLENILLENFINIEKGIKSLTSFVIETKDHEEKRMVEMSEDAIDIIKIKLLEISGANSSFKENVTDILNVINGLSVKNTLLSLNEIVEVTSKKVSKKVIFKVDGSDLFLAKEVVIPLKDSLSHIIRNAVDHGIEPFDKRKILGKEEEGTILLTFKKEINNTLEIFVKDDGSGINGDVLLEKAILKGLISKEMAKKMTEEDKLNLIFSPSLSIKDEITDISGRGVGMDAVKKEIERLGGSIRIESILGKGTTFIFKIPTNLS